VIKLQHTYNERRSEEIYKMSALSQRWALLSRVKKGGLIATVAIIIVAVVALSVVFGTVLIRRRRRLLKLTSTSTSAAAAVPAVACKPSGRFQVPYYSGGVGKLNNNDDSSDSRTSPTAVQISFDFSKVCDAKRVSWQYASGLRGQPSATSDFEEFAFIHRDVGNGSKRVKNPSLLKGSGWVRVVADSQNQGGAPLAPPLQLPPTFSSAETAVYNLEWK
jgi:hypothetical protein